ncbi:MAG: RINT-1/TIP-20 [Olpidium bornovanus]|uniref:RINT-1/TIP-20 n=1 Tax=Olpidium bornovanus TaxID=278681 RepID=A0A8H7ZT69_9FUNG|nr:MAG: RINT-1/TIP-20 [Olpidium bornovanus]
MTEAYRFDEAIRNDYLYLDPAAGAEWPGTLEVLAGNQEVFDAFLRTEKEFALHKFAEIVEADDAWTIIDEEGGDDDDSRPTHSADRVCILVAAVTEKYPQVSRKAHRIRLFVSLQVAILERYCDAMQKIVDVHGRSGVALTEAASVRLCAVLCSALHVASVLKEWSEDVVRCHTGAADIRP